MRIAVIGTRGFPNVQGGVERHCECLYSRFGGPVEEIKVYRRCPYLSPETKSSHYPRISFVDLPSTRIKGFEAVFHTFLCCLHLLFHRVDVVHIHNIGPGMFTPLLRLFGFKVVITYHSANYEHKKWGAIAKMILRLSESLSFGFANEIIFVNKFQMEKAPASIQKKSVYIPNGIDCITRSCATDYLEKIGAEKGGYVLGVGRLTPEKGFEYLVKAVNQLDEVKQLVIAGAADHGDGYLQHLKDLDVNKKTIFAGFVGGEDLRQLYSHARMFVLSSVNEGFPLVMLEAMGYGLPIVVSDIPATHLVVLPEGCYATSCDVNSFKKRIGAMYADCGKVAYDLSDYDWDEVVRQTHAMYCEAVQ
ncbi:MAG: glycosyltransferase family 4 protein [Muribaculaceae bacterium]|nr:glycosyltransferase family 4 protein [Muribaculaceae bacterium]